MTPLRLALLVDAAQHHLAYAAAMSLTPWLPGQLHETYGCKIFGVLQRCS
jgi:hypothetical protein